jgi:uncharacterized membrane protein YeaQ/YmgE (transglycosylase-associated protein family)
VSLLTFLLTAFIVGTIAKALVPGRDLGAGLTILLGAIAQVGAWLALHAAGLTRYGQLGSLLASVAFASILLSLYENASPSPRPRLEIEPPGPDLPAVPAAEAAPPRPAPPSLWQTVCSCGDWAAVGGLLMGVTGFMIGFFGPIRFQPWANQGPMVGIFLTGPGGALLGAVVGAALRLTHPEWTSRRRMWMLGAANVAWGLFVLDLVVDRSWWH